MPNLELLKQFKKEVLILVSGASLLATSFFMGGHDLINTNNSSNVEVLGVESNTENKSSPSKIVIEVSGAVFAPGVYEFEMSDRVADAIQKAGGVKPSANIEYLEKSVNRASKLVDGQKIYIPYKNEKVQLSGSGKTRELVNINEGSQMELESLPGVGPATALKIISGRPYAKPEDLVTNKIITQKVFTQIRDLISLY